MSGATYKYLGIPAGSGGFLFAISTSIVWLSLSPRVEVFGAKRIEAFRYSFNGLCYDLGNYFLRDALPQQPVYTRYDFDIRKTQHGVMLLQCSLDVLRQIFWRWSVGFHPPNLWRCACDVTGTPFLAFLAFLVLATGPSTRVESSQPGWE
jgi:hypothetical protein